MAASTLVDLRLLACTAMLLVLPATAAHAATLQLHSDEPITYSYDEAEIDLSKDVHTLRGNVQVTQGPMLLTSEEAVIREPQSERSRWTFDRNVHIQTPEVDLRADAASAVVTNGQLAYAQATGSPARFEQRGGEPGRAVDGRARTIDYDLAASVLTLTGEVRLVSGGNEFRGDTVVYNMREGQVQINPGGRGPNRVNITIRPDSFDGARGTQGGDAPADPQPERGESGA